MRVAKEMSKYLVVRKEPESVAVLARDIGVYIVIAVIASVLVNKVKQIDNLCVSDIKRMQIWDMIIASVKP